MNFGGCAPPLAGDWSLVTYAGELDYVPFPLAVSAGAAADMASISAVVGLLACTKSTQHLSSPLLSSTHRVICCLVFMSAGTALHMR